MFWWLDPQHPTEPFLADERVIVQAEGDVGLVEDFHYLFHVQIPLHAEVQQGNARLEIPPAVENAGRIRGRFLPGLHPGHYHQLAVIVLADMGVWQVGQDNVQDAVDVHGRVSMKGGASGKKTPEPDVEAGGWPPLAAGVAIPCDAFSLERRFR
jgi:hypothetical protein